MADEVEIQGTCHDDFALVRQELATNFAERGEVGASVCVTIDGETVVDLWGGTADPKTGTPWERDTMAVVFSVTKGATATCAHVLAARGELDLEQPVATYWPEFAQQGKGAIPVWMLLAHQAGLPAVRRHLADGDACDWGLMTDALAAETPFWEPGTRHGYHAATFGWLVGEVVRRVSGRSLGTFFREEIADPLDLDFWIGLPEELESRVAPIVSDDPIFPTAQPPAPTDEPVPLMALVFGNTGIPDRNSRAAHAAELGAAGGIGNARGLAGLYRPLALGGSFGGVTLVHDLALCDMSRCASAGLDAVIGLQSRFTRGYYKTWPSQTILSEEAFGHLGAGGAVSFAEPAARMSFGYVMNSLDLVLTTDRAQSLVDAAYRCAGYRTRAGGVWIR
jgi:CubicO group peptidase (beta-lactamase class C family)